MSFWTIIILLVVGIGGYIAYDKWREGDVIPWYVSEGNVVSIGGERRLSATANQFEITAPTGMCWEGNDNGLAELVKTENASAVTIRVSVKNQASINPGDCKTSIVEPITLGLPMGQRQLLMDDGENLVPARFSAR